MSPTRKRVKQMLAKGVPVRKIAHELGISTQAVYKHKYALEAEKTTRKLARV